MLENLLGRLAEAYPSEEETVEHADYLGMVMAAKVGTHAHPTPHHEIGHVLEAK